MRLVVVSCPPVIVDNGIRDDFVFAQSIAVDLRVHQRLDQALARRNSLFADSIAIIRGDLLHGAEHMWDAVGIVLKVAEDF